MLVQAVQNYLVEVVTRKGISILQIIMELKLEVHEYSDTEEPREDLCDASKETKKTFSDSNLNNISKDFDNNEGGEIYHSNVKNSSILELLNESVISRSGHLKRDVNTEYEKQKHHSCTRCMKISNENRGLKKHIDSVHGGWRDYACPRCTKIFRHSHVLKKHIDSIHLD